MARGSTSRKVGVAVPELLDRVISGRLTGGQVCGQTLSFQFSRSEMIFLFQALSMYLGVDLRYCVGCYLAGQISFLKEVRAGPKARLTSVVY